MVSVTERLMARLGYGMATTQENIAPPQDMRRRGSGLGSVKAHSISDRGLPGCSGAMRE
jgi:hypothetical protein